MSVFSSIARQALAAVGAFAITASLLVGSFAAPSQPADVTIGTLA